MDSSARTGRQWRAVSENGERLREPPEPRRGKRVSGTFAAESPKRAARARTSDFEKHDSTNCRELMGVDMRYDDMEIAKVQVQKMPYSRPGRRRDFRSYFTGGMKYAVYQRKRMCLPES